MFEEMVSFTMSDEFGNRVEQDRRQNAIKSFFYSFFMRRRRIPRRETDRTANIYIDIHEFSTFVLFSLVLIFCVIDAVFTLYILNNGGKEINPFMDYLLNQNVMTFFWVKFLLTSFGMLFLVSHKHFVIYRVFNGYFLLKIVFALYLSLIAYELYIIFRFVLF